MLENDCTTLKTSTNLFLVDGSGVNDAHFKMRRDVLYNENVCFSCTDGTDTAKTVVILASVSCRLSSAKFTAPAGF